MNISREQLWAIADEIEALKKAGRWTEAEFLRIFRAAKERETVPPGQSTRLTFILREAEPDWLARIKG